MVARRTARDLTAASTGAFAGSGSTDRCTSGTGRIPRCPSRKLGALVDLQEQGKIRHIGLSEVTPEEIDQSRKTAPIVTVQNRYNIADREA